MTISSSNSYATPLATQASLSKPHGDNGTGGERDFGSDIKNAKGFGFSFEVTPHSTQNVDGPKTENGFDTYTYTAEVSLEVSVSGNFKAVSGSYDHNQGNRVTYLVTVPHGTGSIDLLQSVNPFDPSTIPVGGAVTLDTSQFTDTQFEAGFMALNAGSKYHNEQGTRIIVERQDADSVRVLTGPTAALSTSDAVGLDLDYISLSLTQSRKIDKASLQAANFELSTSNGQGAFNDFVVKGDMPECNGDGVFDVHNVYMESSSSNGQFDVATFGNLSIPVPAGSSGGSYLTITQPDGSKRTSALYRMAADGPLVSVTAVFDENGQEIAGDKRHQFIFTLTSEQDATLLNKITSGNVNLDAGSAQFKAGDQVTLSFTEQEMQQLIEMAKARSDYEVLNHIFPLTGYGNAPVLQMDPANDNYLTPTPDEFRQTLVTNRNSVGNFLSVLSGIPSHAGEVGYNDEADGMAKLPGTASKGANDGGASAPAADFERSIYSSQENGSGHDLAFNLMPASVSVSGTTALPGGGTSYDVSAQVLVSTADHSATPITIRYRVEAPGNSAVDQTSLQEINPLDPESLPHGTTVRLNGADFIGTTFEPTFHGLAIASGTSIYQLQLSIHADVKQGNAHDPAIASIRIVSGARQTLENPAAFGPSAPANDRTDFTTNTTLIDTGMPDAKDGLAAFRYMLVSGTLPSGTTALHETNGSGEIDATATDTASGEVNAVTWTYDSQGRPTHADATLNWEPTSAGRNSDRTEASAQSKFRTDNGMAGSGDDTGHVIAYRFVNGHGPVNMFPQDSHLNRIVYARMEQEWSDWLSKGMEVRIHTDLTPKDTQRPDQINVEYDVVDPETGKVIYDTKKAIEFKNQAGQVFNPIAKTEMDELIANT